MILVQNCRMIDPASQTDSLRDILIGEDRITKIAEAGTINPAQITKEKEDELRILNADGLIAVIHDIIDGLSDDGPDSVGTGKFRIL